MSFLLNKQLREVRGAWQARDEELSPVAAAAPRWLLGPGGMGAAVRSQRRCRPAAKGAEPCRGLRTEDAGVGRGSRRAAGSGRETPGSGEGRAALCSRQRWARAGGSSSRRAGSYLRCGDAR